MELRNKAVAMKTETDQAGAAGVGAESATDPLQGLHDFVFNDFVILFHRAGPWSNRKNPEESAKIRKNPQNQTTKNP